MNNLDVMFSSSKMDWETPQALFDKLDDEFGFNTDDGLKQDWHGVCWMNPPYGKRSPNG